MRRLIVRPRGLRLRIVVELTGAVVVFALAITANVGRIEAAGPAGIVGQTLSFTLVSIAIGATSLSLRLSVAVVALLLTFQLLVPIARFDSSSWPSYVALAYVVLMAGRAKIRRWRWVGFGVLAWCGLTAALLLTIPEFNPAGDVGIATGITRYDENLSANASAWSVTAVGLVFLLWLAGAGLAARGARIARDHDRERMSAALSAAERELRATDERERIAQDVHDIMAHSLAVIVAQADGARYLSEKRPDATRHSLEAIAAAARESLVEVRMLIDSLHPEPQGHSRPSIDQIDGLTTRMADAGVRILRSDLGAPLTLLASQEMAAYRIVQEGLTNVLKHADPANGAELQLAWAHDGLTISITSFGTALRDLHPSTGNGIRGMRERARMAGGWCMAGPDERRNGAFTVTAFLPSQARSNGLAIPLTSPEKSEV